MIWTRIVGIVHSPEKSNLIFRDMKLREAESKRDKSKVPNKHSAVKSMLSIKKDTKKSQTYPWKYEPWIQQKGEIK